MRVDFNHALRTAAIGMALLVGIAGSVCAAPFSLDWSAEFPSPPATTASPLSDTDTNFVLETFDGNDFNIASFSGKVGISNPSVGRATSLRRSSGEAFTLSFLNFGAENSSPFTLDCFATGLDGTSHNCGIGVTASNLIDQEFTLPVLQFIGGNFPITELSFLTPAFNDVFLISASGDDDPCGTNSSLPGCPVETGGNGNGGSVPEPGSLALFGIGMAALAIARRRRQTACP